MIDEQAWRALHTELTGAHPALLLQLGRTAGQDAVVISMIRVAANYQRQGIASEVLEALCAEADRQGVALAGTPSREFGTPKSVLNRLFRSYGFARRPREDFSHKEQLVRPPRLP